MKTIQSLLERPGLISGCIIALIIMFCAGGPVFAARVAGADENVNTTTAPENTVKKIIKATPAVPDASIKQTIPPADQTREVKTENVKQTPEKIQDEKPPAHHTRKVHDNKYVTLDFDNVDISDQ